MNGVITLARHDAGELFTLQRAAYVTEAQAHDDPHLPPLTESLEEVRSALTDTLTTTLGIRDDGGRLVASIRMTHPSDSNRADFGRFMVAPDVQGHGLGGRLLAAAENHLSTSVTEVRLITGEHSPANLRLYARHGYQETGREQTSAGYAVVHLVKRLR